MLPKITQGFGKEKGVDIILPSILVMDKTHIDLGARLQMEPTTISHGLLKHSVRRLPITMRILGYINHSTPAHLQSLADLDTELNAPTGIPKQGYRGSRFPTEAHEQSYVVDVSPKRDSHADPIHSRRIWLFAVAK